MWSTGRFSKKIRVFLQKTRRASVLDCGLISKKSEEFLAKYHERDSGSRVDFRKVEGFFSKNDRGSPDLGRLRGRSNGHEKPATWTRWLRELATPNHIFRLIGNCSSYLARPLVVQELPHVSTVEESMGRKLLLKLQSLIGIYIIRI